ncbi:glyoxalase/bleomycin resistance protein/dihydroxybiphenyl dioxygenase [Lucifera butyrica]|uniref:Glyoxalase/bleomycin resistance protein/dihydroxybiphenyl dioxygenase n=1 Tax=Lucifera butyrica TaxID=1351585 RepID=A0A498R9Y1_9FIRM|nr:VOC family protein [Lucifera butyrica]VBB08344.1 glyoxalase/bleomycin resistance protein/dihydroxybiphenyl dioxygenase [Lucifera butyrica]
MKIAHMALWVRDLEAMKQFYTVSLDGLANAKYYNPKSKFSSYFITFAGEAKLEIMHRPEAEDAAAPSLYGYAHLAFAAGGREQVDLLTERLRQAGCTIVSEPRVTGDGFYESCILDPEGNRVEITD